MKLLIIGAGLTAALNSSLVWGSRALEVFDGAPEPLRLVVWGTLLLFLAGNVKRRQTPAAAESRQAPVLAASHLRRERKKVSDGEPAGFEGGKLQPGYLTKLSA